jgi:ubiquinone biosynthesis protein
MHRERLHLQHIDYGDILQRVRELLCNEVDLTTEQQHLSEAATLYREHRNIAIPGLLPHCSQQITAMEFLNGDHVTSVDTVKNSQILANTVAQALVAVPMFNRSPSVLFHGDPHGGNLLLTAGGQLGLIDWGLAGHLSKFHREQVMQVLVGCLTLDLHKICKTLDMLAVQVKDPRILQDRVQTALTKIAQQPGGGISCMMELLDSVVTGGDVIFDEDMLLFRKLVHIAEGVIADLDPSCTLDRVLMRAGFQQFCLDGLFRMLATPCSRAFGTHLSNMDLAEIFSSGPLVAIRRWQVRTQTNSI